MTVGVEIRTLLLKCTRRQLRELETPIGHHANVQYVSSVDALSGGFIHQS